MPLYFVIPQFYGCISNDQVDVFDKKIFECLFW